MAYLSLYRTYRSQTFSEVIGQDHVTQTLVNAIDEGRLHHAWLFTGPRGTGKTSTARILAKAVNCEQGPTSTPCLECHQCVSIADGTSVDVIELDMASHGGVDDARELRDRALFAPASARMKVYILDEVHMASPAAFNALLKLIEEPPGHVMFAMATTDPHKILPTILSRVQRLDLHRIPAQQLADHLRDIVGREGASIDDDALEGIVRAGDGSARDSLSVLEQVLAYAGETVTADHVRSVLGVSAVEHAVNAVDHVLAGDVAAALGLVHDLTETGQDLRRFTLDLVHHVRDLLAAAAAPEQPDLIDATAEHRAVVVEQAAHAEQATLLRMLTILGEVLAEQRQVSPRLPLELALARLSVPGADGDVAALADRVARLEAGRASAPTSSVAPKEAPAAESKPPARAKARGKRSTNAAKAAAPADESADDEPAPAEDPAPNSTSEGPTVAEVVEVAVDATLERVEAAWDSVLESVKDASKRVYAVFEPAQPVRLRDGILTLRYGKRYASFHAERARDSGYADVLRDAINELVSIRVRVDTEVEGDPAPAPHPPKVSDAGFTDEPDDRTRADVAEAEAGELDPEQAQAEAEALLVSELGATPIE